MQPTYYLNKVLSSQVLKDLEAGKYIHGVAVHWYFDSFVPADLTLGATHHIFPEYYLFGTEACAGWNPLDRGVKLGSWQRAEQYAHDIMEVRASVLLQNCCVVLISIQWNGSVIPRWSLTPLHPQTTLQCRSLSCSQLRTLFLCNLPYSTSKQAATCVS